MLTTSMTDTSTYGYKVSFQTSITGNAVFATVSATMGAEWSQSWSSSKTVTSEVEFDYNMSNGEVCVPTTVQYYVTCQNSLKLNDPSVKQWAFVPAGAGVPSSIMLSCDNMDPWDNAPGSNLTDFKAFCDAVQSGAPMKATMNIVRPGEEQLPWSLMGCMFN